jgi:hypothetical protein
MDKNVLESIKTFIETLLKEETVTAISQGVTAISQAKTIFTAVLAELMGWEDWSEDSSEDADETTEATRSLELKTRDIISQTVQMAREGKFDRH